MKPFDVTFSVVLYRNKREQVQRVIGNMMSVDLNIKIYVIDNSPDNDLEDLCRSSALEYIFNNKNVGFGAGHNIAIRKALNASRYHVVLNPDVYFQKGTIETLYHYMNLNSSVGMVVPKIIYPDGSPQYLCKLLPTPFDLVMRRFVPIKKLLDKRNDVYEMRFTGYNKIMDVPYMSGCFMFIRTDILADIGYFDEKIFMYLEDLDLTRRIRRFFRTVYFPGASIFHEYEKGSYRSFKLLTHHIRSAIYYFNKWGWFRDKERSLINQKILQLLEG